MLSRYGFEFENTDDSGDFWGNNPNLVGYNMMDKPFFSMATGFMTLQAGGVNQIGQVGYIWGSTTADTSSARDLTFQNGNIWGAARHYRSNSVSLRY